MKPITTTKELQRIEAGILSEIHSFCTARRLRYTLCGGTLLGAIRHKGFIPWDDDIDIALPRPDYERFCREFSAPHCSVHCFENDPTHCYPYAKVYDDRTVLVEASYRQAKAGVYVDVFPIDGFPDRNRTPRRLERGRRIVWACHVFTNCNPFNKRRSFPRQLVLLFMLPFRLLPIGVRRLPSQFFLPRFQRAASRLSPDRAPFVGVAVWGYGSDREILPRDVFADCGTDVSFEGETRKAISGWKEYLTSLYGDFMTPPPPEKRVSHHAFRAWWKDGFEPCDPPTENDP